VDLFADCEALDGREEAPFTLAVSDLRFVADDVMNPGFI
jgi:hypothetical protein